MDESMDNKPGPKTELITISEGEPITTKGISRRTLLKGAGVLAGAAALSSCNRAVNANDTLEVTYADVMIPHLPPSFDGMTVTLASDFHSSPYMSKGDLKNI